jgi:hypothetical protein
MLESLVSASSNVTTHAITSRQYAAMFISTLIALENGIDELVALSSSGLATCIDNVYRSVSYP